MARRTKDEILLRIPRKQLRELANYVLEFVEIERDSGYGEDAYSAKLLRLELAAKDVILATKKRRLVPIGK